MFTVFKHPTIEQWQHELAKGHTDVWLASFITIWAIAVIILSWWLVSTHAKYVKWLLAGIILYEVLP